MVEIYRPSVENSCASFELETPSIPEFHRRVLRAQQHHAWMVMVERETVLGYAYGNTHRSRPAYRYSVETSVYVHKKFRGQGIGKELYNELLEQLTVLGYCNAFAGITLPNPASVKLHQSLGFEEVGVFRKIGFKEDRWHDVGWWQRSLADHA